MNKFIGEILLFIVTVIWGMAFVWQNIASKFLGPLTVVGFRAGIAVIFLTIVVIASPNFYKSQEPKMKIKSSKNKNILLSCLCGVVLFLAMYIQQIGLEHTTAGKAGFISVLYICIVPLIGVFFGTRLNKFFIIGLVLSVIGFYLLCVKEEFTLSYGDLFVLISALFFALHIMVIDYTSVRVNSMFLSIFQLFVVGVLSITSALIKETITWEAVSSVLPHLLALGVLSSGVAYTLQIIGQREVPAHTASLILSLEAVIAAIGGVIFLHEELGARELSGMIIVFIGILLSQVKDKKKE